MGNKRMTVFPYLSFLGTEIRFLGEILGGIRIPKKAMKPAHKRHQGEKEKKRRRRQAKGRA
jgi:hypothetical protein